MSRNKGNRVMILILILNFAFLAYALATVRTPYSLANLIERVKAQMAK